MFLEGGSCEVIVRKKIQKVLKTGDCFGELALLKDTPRSAGIKAKEICKLWVIDRTSFKKVLENVAT